MAGKGVTRFRVATLKSVGESGVFSTFLEKGSVGAVAAEYFAPRHEGETPGVQAFYDWLREEEGRWERWQEIKRLRGTLDADDAVEAARAATPQDVQVRRLQAETFKWRAGVLNSEYSDKRSLHVHATTGDQWLAALMALCEGEEPPVLEAEVEEQGLLGEGGSES